MFKVGYALYYFMAELGLSTRRQRSASRSSRYISDKNDG